METILNSEQMIEKAGLNWKVLSTPVLFEGNGLKEYVGKKVNYREDNGFPLGVVGDGYKVVQNSTAFAFLDSFLGESIENYVKAGSWKDGARIYIRAKLPGTLIFAGNENDTGEKYVDFHTSHDGSISLEASILAWRLVCSNGLKAFKKLASVKARHTLHLNLDSMKESLGLLNNQFNVIQELSNKMAAQPFERNHFGNVLEKIGLIPAEPKRSTRAQNILQYVESLFANGKGANLEGTKGTTWGAYNAITEYVDHYRGNSVVKREESASIGSGALIKEKALEVLSV
ncbi:MAG TPA: DUF932 domain-containing protein [Nitrosopumilaceae archaeon]|jgi:phage/plasmid-like protein (TIGR03299 family)|nr:DUF932 domain-containing protein [Nitrosopumilaceae archaeon]